MGELLLDKEVNATFRRRAKLPGFGETEVMSIRVSDADATICPSSGRLPFCISTVLPDQL